MHPVYQQQQHQQYHPQQPNPYAQHQSGFPQQIPYNPYAPVQTPTANGQPAGPPPQSQFPPLDPFNSLATSMLQQSGSNYLERGQEFVKSRMLINSSSLHYHFDVDGEYGMCTVAHFFRPAVYSFHDCPTEHCRNCSQKQTHNATGTLLEAVVLYSNKGAGLTAYCHAQLCMYLTAASIPWTRNALEATHKKSILLQITGGHPFKSPRQDVNAPDLYIPVLALFTYCICGSICMVVKGQWTTDSMYALVSPTCAASAAEFFLQACL